MNIELTQSTGKLIKDPQLLDVNYLPEEMVGRKEILRKTVDELSQMPSSHLLLYGFHGRGRYIFAVHVKNRLKYHVEQSGKKFLFATVDCRKHRTTNQIISEIVRQIDPDNPHIKGKKKIDDPFFLLEKITFNDNIVFMVLLRHIDEAKDTLFVYKLSRLHDPWEWSKKYRYDLEKAPMTITVGTAINIRWMKDELDASTLSTYRPHRLVLPLLSNEEIYRILENRSEAFYEGVLDKDVLLACAKEGEDFGSPQFAIKLLRSASIIAELFNSKKITLKHFKIALFEDEINFAVDWLRPYSNHLKLILHSIVKLSKANVDINTTRVYEQYCLDCKEFSIKPLKRRGFYPYLYTLEVERIINKCPVSSTKGGHTFQISMVKDREDLMERVSRRLMSESVGRSN
jgi:cell division control protein 6